LIGKKVYNPDGELVGEVYDISLSVGESEIRLLIRGKHGGELSVSWSSVAAAKDIVILKECVEIPELSAPEPSPEPAYRAEPTPGEERETRLSLSRILPLSRGKQAPRERRVCPTCGEPATWIPQYKRWYCYNCKKYID